MTLLLQNSNQTQQRAGLINGISAVLAGTMEQVLHPFEIMKFRLQSIKLQIFR